MNPTETKLSAMESFVKLFDEEQPACIYCKTLCGISSRTVANDGKIWTTNTYSCIECKETVNTYVVDGLQTLFDPLRKMPVCYDFRLSCNELVLWYGDNPENFLVGNRVMSVHWAKIPTFVTDFSDKNKLYRKLKTYLLFS